MSLILTLNTGSSSLKFGLYEDAAEPDLLLHGQVDGIGAQAQLIFERHGEKTKQKVPAATPAAALEQVIAALRTQMPGLSITGIG
ncbi:MAG: acetate kinase, partial [Pseudomonadota bacterium]